MIVIGVGNASRRDDGAGLAVAPPGTVSRFDVPARPRPARVLRSSTHAFGVADAVELGRALGRLPTRIEVYTIEGADFTAGATLTPAVARAGAKLAVALALSSAPALSGKQARGAPAARAQGRRGTATRRVAQ